MLPSARPNANSPRPSAGRGRCGLVVAAIALGLSVVWSAAKGDDASDSGWAVGTPAAAILDARPRAPNSQNVVERVLKESPLPVLREGGPKLLHPADGTLRLAQRPEANGWRAGALNSSQLVTLPSARSESRDSFPAELPLTLVPPRPPVPDDESDVPAAAADDEAVVSDQPDDEADGRSEAAEADVDAQADITPIEEESDETAAEDATAESESESEGVDQEQSDPTTESHAETVPAAPLPQVEPAPLPPLTRQLVNLRNRVRSVLKGYYRKPLNSREHDCWEVMHGMLSYGIHSRVLQGSPRGEPITAVGWLCYNKPCKGLTLMYVTPQGELRAKWGVGLQGHSGQLLAMLAQCKVSPDYPIHVGKHQFSIHDLIEAEKKTCYPKSELTFKLLAFQQYLDLNDRWVNDQGLDWDIPRLIREELAQPIRGAACGGTHRLSALSLTVKARQRRGEPLDGEYARAADFVEKYEKYAFRLQNRDGSLSTSWFQGRGDEDDDDRRIKTTGHILEWLCYSLDDQELRQPQTVRAVWYLANLMYSNYDHEWEIGPRSHALHALLLYDERVFKPFDKAGEMANYRPTTRSNSRSANRSQPRSTANKR